jgi:hypothetical protein
MQLLYNIKQKYNIEISIKNSKVRVFQGKYPIRPKTVINNQTIEQVKNFNYLDYDLSHNCNEDLQNKLFKFQHMFGIIK